MGEPHDSICKQREKEFTNKIQQCIADRTYLTGAAGAAGTGAATGAGAGAATGAEAGPATGAGAGAATVGDAL